MKTHFVKDLEVRFTDCAKDREGRRLRVAVTPGDVTCPTCVHLLWVAGAISEVEYVDFKIRRLEARRDLAATS